jgi:hypothetical protein
MIRTVNIRLRERIEAGLCNVAPGIPSDCCSNMVQILAGSGLLDKVDPSESLSRGFHGSNKSLLSEGRQLSLGLWSTALVSKRPKPFYRKDWYGPQIGAIVRTLASVNYLLLEDSI